MVLVCAGVGTFSSCKDTNEEDIAALELSQQDLQDLLQDQIDALEALLATYESCDCYKITEEAWLLVQSTLEALQEAIDSKADQDDLDALAAQYEDLLKAYETLAGTVAGIQEDITTLSTLIEQLQAILDGITNADLKTLTGMSEFSITIDGTTYTGDSNTLSEILNAMWVYILKFQADLEDRVATLETLTEDYDSLKTVVTNNTNNISILSDSLSSLTTVVTTLQNTVDSLQSEVDSLWSTLNAALEDLKPRVTALEEAVASLSDTVSSNYQNILEILAWMARTDTTLSQMSNDLDSLEHKYEYLFEMTEGLSYRVDTLSARVTEMYTTLSSQISELDGKIIDLTATVDSLSERVDTLETTVASNTLRITDLETALAALSEIVAQNSEDIAELQEDVEDLLEKYESLLERLESLVTSIIIQGTENPVFGTFNLPLNISSNMLVSYYGYAELDVLWPRYSSLLEYDNSIVFTADDIEMLSAGGNWSQFEASSGDCLLETDEGNAGVVYLTINPNNVDFEGLDLSMVNSQDEESTITLEGLEKSDQVLTFGYTRSSDNNGFYQAHATLTESGISGAAVEVADGLKSSIKNLVSAGTSASLSDIASLVEVLYNQFNGILPAYGLKAAWTADNGEGVQTEYAVYSEYKLAATAFKPLSFKFLYGWSSSKTLPSISAIYDLFNVDFGEITFDFDYDFDFDFDVNYNMDTLKYTLWMSNDTLYMSLLFPTKDEDGRADGGYDTVTITITGNMDDDVANLVAQALSLINSNIEGWEAEALYMVQDLMDQVYDYIDEYQDKIAAKLNEMLSDVIDELEDEVNDLISGILDKFTSFFDIYNTMANKVNSILTDPNHYLQVTMYYNGADGSYHHLSTDKAWPTSMIIDGGNTTTLLVTTYTGEILAPAYKKFVGVTNVWKTDDEDVSAVNGDATCKSLLVAANSLEYLDTPISGKVHRVPFSASTAGYTYEIVYSALDYAGYTSSRKFYVSVK